MGNHLTTCRCIGTSIDQPLYQPRELESEQRDKLEEFFHHITSNAPVDYSNEKIKDIQNAVSIMLKRIRTRVNKRGIFCAQWKCCRTNSLWKSIAGDHYLEFDCLAVLKNTIKQCEEQSSRQHCQGCIAIVKPSVEYNRDEFCGEIF